MVSSRLLAHELVVNLQTLQVRRAHERKGIMPHFQLFSLRRQVPCGDRPLHLIAFEYEAPHPCIGEILLVILSRYRGQSRAVPLTQESEGRKLTASE